MPKTLVMHRFKVESKQENKIKRIFHLWPELDICYECSDGSTWAEKEKAEDQAATLINAEIIEHHRHPVLS
jgi:hypothetical protein